MKFFKTHESRWIGMADSDAAPYFFTTFDCGETQGAQVAVCGLGYYELYINGLRVGDRVLEPIVSVYDHRVRYNVLDVSGYLVQGVNSVGVILGHGWYDHKVGEVWNFEHAYWRHHPKLRLEMRAADGSLLLSSTRSWMGSTDGPITHTQLRNGEHYDARREFPGWPAVDFVPDGRWRKAATCAAPGGVLEAETALPCRVVRTFEIVGRPNVFGVYDIGTNLAGRCRITVRGTGPGTKVGLDYAERITEDGELSGYAQDSFVKSGKFQHEEYFIKGDGSDEVWESRFTYHGFRYVKVGIHGGEAALLKIEVREIGTDLTSVGSFESSSADLNRLQELTRVSFLANFVGIPTDCPHREKNGWTGDAQLACETGLYNFNPAASYGEWVDTLRDCQRPSGELPGIAPSAGWGYNWGNGPNWDGALFVVPYHVYLYTGDDSLLRKNYEAMRLYLDFCDSVSDDDIVVFGLGDWCPPLGTKMVDGFFSTTAAYYGLVVMFADIAAHFGRTDDVKRCREQAQRIKDNFNKKFYNGNGVYADGGLTAQGTPLYFGLCHDGEGKAVLQTLVSASEQCGCTAQFGILGAKHVPRVLADNGYADLALRFFTQEQYPGWVNWLRRGAVSLWETWEGAASRNHIMFGDLSAWLFRYAAGFKHQPENPGWKRLSICPENLKALDSVKADYRGYVSHWTRDKGVFTLEVTVPKGCTADVVMPDGRATVCEAGVHTLHGAGSGAGRKK